MLQIDENTFEHFTQIKVLILRENQNSENQN